MPSQLLLAISPPPADRVEGGGVLPAAVKREDFSENINLDLGIGSLAVNGEGLKEKKKNSVKQEKRECVFTARQFHDFYNQIFVYNFIAFGLPVPFHLFLPIWMNVCNTYGPAAIYNKYPSFTGFRPANSDCLTTMDPEPGRCRRTDGRKWRCRQNVVPNQKYCEQHMHRGRRPSSRKHVEPSEAVSRAYTDIKNPTSSCLVTSDVENKMTISSLTDPNRGIPRLDRGNSVPALIRSRSNRNRDDRIGNIFDENIRVDTINRRNQTEVMDAGSKNGYIRKISTWKHHVCKSDYVGFVSPGIGLSRKTVLHCGKGKVSLGLTGESVMQTEPQRCRRTDGKKWQCSRDAVPYQKYCEAHMHRGVKRPVLIPESSSTHKSRISHTIPESLDNNRINLSFAPSSPPPVPSNDSTSSTSDATTITDENIGACLISQSLIRKC